MKHFPKVNILMAIVTIGLVFIAGPRAHATSVQLQHTIKKSHFFVNNPIGHTQVVDNWAGYANTLPTSTDQYTDIKGNWVEPATTCINSTDRVEYASFWVGLDGNGSGSHTVEQIGADAVCKYGVLSYQPWWELYPNPTQNLAKTRYPVHANDSMFAEVSITSRTLLNTTFTLTMKNLTRNWQFTVTQSLLNTNGQMGTSAEWITEDLGRPLCNFGTAEYTSASATLNNMTTGSISAFPAQSTSITDNLNVILASPSALNPDGTSFTNTWYNSL